MPVGHPLALTLVLLRPVGLLACDGGLEEPIQGPGVVLGLVLGGLWRAGFGYFLEVVVDVDVDSSLFPGFSLCGLRAFLVYFPSALWQNPALPPRGLDEEDIFLVVGKGNYASDKAFSFGIIP